MPARIRVGTFNCENLFARYRFDARSKPAPLAEDGFTINQVAFEILDEPEKSLTARVISALDADVIALQEVESLDLLKRFRSRRLASLGYAHAILIDGNDPRFIDVAVLSRYPIVRVRSHQDERQGRALVFSRDCLEVDVDVEGRPLALFVNHFKSMIGGRGPTRAKRERQARAVKDLVTARFGAALADQPFVICGDFNDYLGEGQGSTDGIRDLVCWSAVENVQGRLPEPERWTYFQETRKSPDARPEAYHQLDYLLLSSKLARATSAVPLVVRSGLCRNAALYQGKRFPGVGDSRPAASDHCAVGIDIALG
ncbi:MAG TPA: endonuclease/exonuclease/phosphatase family protein [Terriglobales bacterium]|nr:endonuclease/exonuclease/phosphatase family protein [Terriglobales bacterium]